MSKLHVLLLAGAAAACSPVPVIEDPAPAEASVIQLLHPTGNPKGGFMGVAVNGKYLYLSTGEGIHLYDVRNGNDAAEVSLFETYGSGLLTMRGDRLYYPDQDGIHVADVSDPATIKPKSLITDTEFDRHAINAIKDNPAHVVVPAFAAGTTNEIILFDLINPEQPEQVARFRAGGGVTSLAIDGDTLYVSADAPPDGFVEVWDVSDWDAPVKKGVARGRCGLLYVVGDGIVYCGQGNSAGAEVHVLDARDPLKPAFVEMSAEQKTTGATWFGASIFLRVGSYVFVKNARVDDSNGGPVIPHEIKNPLHPVMRPFSGSNKLGGAYETAHAMTVDERFVYSAHDDGATIMQRKAATR